VTHPHPTPVAGDVLPVVQTYRRSEAVPVYEDLRANGFDQAAAYRRQRQKEEHRLTVTVHWVRRDGSFQAVTAEGRKYDFTPEGVCTDCRLAGLVRVDWRAAAAEEVGSG
jgi:hypothetical protein